MSLIDNIRSENGIDAVKYEPFFMKFIRLRGYYLISSDSLYKEETNCFDKTRKTLRNWLEENQLKIIEANITDHYKIYY